MSYPGGFGRDVNTEKVQESPADSLGSANATHIFDDGIAFKHDLHRKLGARQVTMIAIGGAIGTGLLIGTGSALAQAGPASILIAYAVVGFVVFLVMCALGEMASFMPLPQSFAGFATRFVDPAFGFATGWCYYFKYIITTPNQLNAAALVIQYWLPASRVNPGVWIAVFLVTVVTINYFGVKIFGEFEFWMSSIKVIVILGVIFLSLIIAAGGVPGQPARGFEYWGNPGAFNTYIAKGAEGKFLAFWSSLTTAVFAYLGTELVAVTAGEITRSYKTIPRAIKLTFWRILVFYVVSVFFLGMCVPYNSPLLLQANKKGLSASASPFVVAILIAGIPVLPAILNGAILLFVISASNSDLYIASRTLYGLACQRKAPAIFARTDRRGVPHVSLFFSSLFCLLGFLNVRSSAASIFSYFVSVISIFGLVVWISILYTHICFQRACRVQGINRKRDLPYQAPFSPYGSYVALIFCCIIAVFKGFNSIAGQNGFNYKTFITSYIGIPVYLVLIFGYKIFYRTRRVRSVEADLVTGRVNIAKEEEEYEAYQSARPPRRAAHLFYDKFVGFLF